MAMIFLAYLEKSKILFYSNKYHMTIRSFNWRKGKVSFDKVAEFSMISKFGYNYRSVSPVMSYTVHTLGNLDIALSTSTIFPLWAVTSIIAFKSTLISHDLLFLNRIWLFDGIEVCLFGKEQSEQRLLSDWISFCMKVLHQLEFFF